jgi:nitroreductase
MIKDLVKKNRSYRRFYEEKKITKDELLDMIDAARLTASGANKQPIRYIISCDDETNSRIFPNLRWAGYLTDWDGPIEGERPTAYIIMLEQAGVNAPNDEGIAGQTILLSAVEKGMGGCFIANVDRKNLAKALNIPSEYAIKLVIALGYPKEKVVLENIGVDDDIKYYRDENQVHHVPKIKLEDIVIKIN